MTKPRYLYVKRSFRAWKPPGRDGSLIWLLIWLHIDNLVIWGETPLQTLESELRHAERLNLFAWRITRYPIWSP